jgi:acyl carrier protein
MADDEVWTNVYAQLRTLVPPHFLITHESRLIDELGLLSDDFSALVIYVEKSVNLKVPPAAFAEVETVGDLIAVLEEHIARKAGGTGP